MNQYAFLVMMSCLLLSGCQSAVHKYDGALGYQVISRDANGLSLVYVDEDLKSWTDIEHNALSACAEEMKANSRQLGLNVVAREQFEQKVDVAYTVPAITTPAYDVTTNTGLNQNVSTVVVPTTQILQRNMRLKKISAECNRL